MIALPGPPAEAWDRLAVAGCNPFATRAFAEAWWRAHGAPGRPWVVADDAAQPSVVVPLYATGRPLRQLRLIGSGPADELGPVCAPHDRARAAAVLRDALDGPDAPPWDVVLLQDVPVEQGWDRLLGATVVGGVASPVVRLGDADWASFLARRSKGFREQARRKERRLERAFAVRLREATSGTVADDVETLLHLHRLRWGAGAAFARASSAELVRRFAGPGLAGGWLRLHVLELDGVPAAALLGVRAGGVEGFWQGGRDPRYDEHSVGSVLLLAAVRCAVEAGASEYRLLRGDEPYKRRLADGDRPVHTVALARTPVGHAAVRVARLRARRRSIAASRA